MNRRVIAATFFTTCIVAGAVLYARTLTKSTAVETPEEEHILFADLKPVSFKSNIGTVTLRVAKGYYGRSLRHLSDDDPRKERGGSTAIFVYVDQPVDNEKRSTLSREFRKATDGEFQLEVCPGGSSGGSDDAFAIISAGTDYRAYTTYLDEVAEGKEPTLLYKGYFKNSTPPNLDTTTRLLRKLIAGASRS
jgi:hypothetical protein